MAQGRTLIAFLSLTLLGCISGGPRSISHARPHFDAGMAAFEQEIFGEAIEHFNEAIEIHPGYGEALYRRGSAELRRVRKGETPSEYQAIETAIEDFTRALRIFPLHHEALYNRGLALLAVGRYREAAQDLQSVLQTQDVNLRRDAHAKLGQILEEKFDGMEAQARKHYEKYTELGGRDGTIHERLSMLRSKDADSTRPLTQEEEATALLLQAVETARKGDKARALRLVKRALVSGMLPKDKRAFAISVYAQWQPETDAESRAVTLLQEARSLAEEGDKDIALTLLEHMRTIYPNTRVVREEVVALIESLREKNPQ